MTVLPEGAFGARVRERLRDEQLIWLITIAADGTPQPNPVWFLWDGAETILIYNRDDAHRLSHVRARPQVTLHFESDAGGGDIVVATGIARPAPDAPSSLDNRAYQAKYARGIERIGSNPAKFAADYPTPFEIELRRIRGF